LIFVVVVEWKENKDWLGFSFRPFNCWSKIHTWLLDGFP